MIVKCFSCQKTLHIDDRLVGKKGRCPACKQIINIPTLSPRKTVKQTSSATPPPIPCKTSLASNGNTFKESSERQTHTTHSLHNKILVQMSKINQATITPPLMPPQNVLAKHRTQYKQETTISSLPLFQSNENQIPYGTRSAFLCGVGIVTGALLPVLVPHIRNDILYFPNIQVLWDNPFDLPAFLLFFPLLVGIMIILWSRGIPRALPDHQKALLIMTCPLLLVIVALFSDLGFLVKEMRVGGYILLVMVGISTGIGVQKVAPEARFGRWLAGISGIVFFVFLFLPILPREIGPMPIQAPFTLLGMGSELMMVGLILLGFLVALIFVAILACLNFRFDSDRNLGRGALIIRIQLAVYVLSLVLVLVMTYVSMWDAVENRFMSRAVYSFLPFLVTIKAGLILLGLMSAFSIAAVQLYTSAPRNWFLAGRPMIGNLAVSTHQPMAHNNNHNRKGSVLHKSRETASEAALEPINIEDKLKQLKKMRDDGLIAEEEFMRTKRELLTKWTQG